jgi:hypothetical protein
MDFTIGGNFNGCMQSLDQQLGIEWLTQESRGRVCQRSFANVYFIVRGGEDDGEPVATSFKPFLHIETVEARHLRPRLKRQRLEFGAAAGLVSSWQV